MRKAAAKTACREGRELVDDSDGMRGKEVVESAYRGRTRHRKGAPDMKRSEGGKHRANDGRGSADAVGGCIRSEHHLRVRDAKDAACQ